MTATDLSGLAARAKDRVPLVDLIGRVVALKRKTGEHVGLCPFHDEKTPSFTVVERKGFYHCFGCGAHGDAITFLMAVDGLSFPDAARALAVEAGLEAGQGMAAKEPRPVVKRDTEAELAAEKQNKIEWARDLFRACRDAHGTHVETYLTARGIDLEKIGGIPASIRYHPALMHKPTGLEFPAMVAAIQDRERRIVGVHRTYLRADGTGKAEVSQAKMMAGVAMGGATRLAHVGEVLGFAEGLETALSVMQAAGGQLEDGGQALPVWAGLSLGNLAGSGDPDVRRVEHPNKPGTKLPTMAPDMERPGILPPEGVKRLILLADGDSGDPEAAHALMMRAAIRYGRLGFEVAIAQPPEGTDFNDILRAAA